MASDADAKRLEAELRAKEIEADLTAKVEAAAGDSEEVKALRSRVARRSEANVAKLRADIEAKDAELELRSIGLRELAGNADRLGSQAGQGCQGPEGVGEGSRARRAKAR